MLASLKTASPRSQPRVKAATARKPSKVVRAARVKVRAKVRASVARAITATAIATGTETVTGTADLRVRPSRRTVTAQHVSPTTTSVRNKVSARTIVAATIDLGNQVRHAFYGAEAQRVQRGIDEIKVMVRYPEADRETVSSLTDMYIRTPQGDEIPFDTVARVDVRQGLLKATHIN